MANTNKKTMKPRKIRFRKGNISKISKSTAIESLEGTPFLKLPLLLIKEGVLQQRKLLNCDKIRSGNKLIEVDKKHAENQIDMKTFHNFKCKVYPLKTSKGVIRNRELSLTTPAEMKITSGMQDVTDYKRIATGRGGEEIQTNIHFDI